MSAHWTENTRALKILIAVMTTLLVIGLIALFVGIARTSKKLSESFSDVVVTVPADARIATFDVDDGRLYLRLEHADGRQSVMVLDAGSGRELGVISFEPAQ